MNCYLEEYVIVNNVCQQSDGSVTEARVTKTLTATLTETTKNPKPIRLFHRQQLLCNVNCFVNRKLCIDGGT
jgi:hypothetical protein